MLGKCKGIDIESFIHSNIKGEYLPIFLIIGIDLYMKEPFLVVRFGLFQMS